MRLYIAALYTSNFGASSTGYRQLTDAGRTLYDTIEHKLESYHYIHKPAFVEKLRRDKVKVFLDSGAFSAFSLGAEIDVVAYANYIKENSDFVEMASVLDAIGDHRGTWFNQNKLEGLGCPVLPCFHYGEPFDVGRYYAENYPYITIGGMVPIANGPLEQWLDEVWEHVLTDEDGLPKTKIHGFGLTSRRLMSRYPWFSVDSSSWVQAAANGSIVMPDFDRAIAISSRSPAKKNFNQHFDTFPAESQERIVAALESYGTNLREVQEDYRMRWVLNAFSYAKLGRDMGPDHWHKPFRSPTNGLF